MSSVKLAHLVKFGHGKDWKTVESPNGNFPVYGSGGKFGLASDFLHDGEAVLFGRKGTVDRPIYVNEKFWTVDTMYYAIPHSDRAVGKYLYYWATTIPFQTITTNTALPSVTSMDLSQLYVPLPTLVTQQRIADYLDRETVEIDAAVADLDRYVELLEKRRLIAIENAIEGKPIPLHCMSRIVDCVHTTPDRDDAGVAEAVRTSSIRNGKYIPGVGIPISLETLTLRTKELSPQPGDLFFTREAPAGEACLVPKDKPYASGQRVVTIRPDVSVVLPEYLLFALYSSQIQLRWETTSTGSTVTNIKMDTIGQTRIPTPPVDLQHQIIEVLKKEFDEIDSLVAESRKLRELLLKRRSVLITDVVTGRKQV
ncbi:restriction endonuclease subunit S [Corynebacterium pacaense]|uniref:restriction endonuclease subunit S n=1 Tax=Corynebacterium pacaense TaxID=1816684 RepID=UPI0015C43BDA|nr:restriction endonuclease subunit S [Corynebacterium pacaense]